MKKYRILFSNNFIFLEIINITLTREGRNKKKSFVLNIFQSTVLKSTVNLNKYYHICSFILWLHWSIIMFINLIEWILPPPRLPSKFQLLLILISSSTECAIKITQSAIAAAAAVKTNLGSNEIYRREKSHKNAPQPTNWISNGDGGRSVPHKWAPPISIIFWLGGGKYQPSSLWVDWIWCAFQFFFQHRSFLLYLKLILP